MVALFNAVAKAKRDTVLEESSKSKPHKEDDTILSREANNSRSSNHKSLSNKSTEPKDKVWKVINDSTEDIPMVSNCLLSIVQFR